MRILSYNVNGIRAAVKKGLLEWLEKDQADILCIQETKAQVDQIDTLSFKNLGYYCHATAAKKKGYSGVAIFSKEEPNQIIYGMGNDKYDDEGRVIRADFGDLTVICVYVPSGTTGGIRQDYKMEFLIDFEEYILQTKKERPNLVVCGDYNIAHKDIDINNPKGHAKTSGFLPEEKEWLTQFLEKGMVDSFRTQNTAAEQYSWWSYRAASRDRNIGWRIDYHLIGENLEKDINSVGILSEIKHSDHCPILLDLNC